MYLKRIEVQGFKSFAGKSVFEFSPGVTAVVGPNGSGKSNLADALRWVLGEQNPRQLRSRKSDEVIFAGGRQRPPAGMAEVSIALDNCNGWLPVEFDEVVFTRRLHRSGESEYLVNRARVRLKDVLDLFSRARVGQNSYAIMGQGLVDSVLNLPPSERRGLIEEAAEVRRHRLKITDAVDRISATRDNLDRVDLLVGEIGPRLAQLQTQARKAASYNELAAELGEALHSLYAAQWRERTVGLAVARAGYEQRMNALVDAQAEVTRIEAELEAVRLDLQQQRDLAGNGETSVRDLDDRLRRCEQRLELLDERQQLLSTRIAEVEADLEALRGELDELSSGGPAEKALVGDEVALDAAIAEQSVELRSAESALDGARRSLAEAEDALRSVRGEAASLEDRTASLQRGLRTLEREKEESTGRRNTMLARLRKLGRDALGMVQQQVGLERDLSAALEEQASLRRRALINRETVEQRDRDVIALRRQLDEASSRLELLTRLRDEQQQSDGATQAILQAANRLASDTPPRILAVLGQLIRVQKGLEQAIEAALDDQLSALIVPETLDAHAALRILVESQAGRATIVPLSDLKPVHPLNLNAERGVLGVASRFVKCDSRFRSLVDTLLGRVIVVEDLQTAEALMRRGLGTAVTLDGTLIRPTGIISGGRVSSGGLVLAYERDLDELPEQVAALQQSLARHEPESAAAKGHARAAETRLHELDRRVDALQGAHRRLMEDGSAVSSAIASLGSESNRLRGIATAFQERRSVLQEELATTGDERRRYAMGVRSAQLVVESARREVESLRAPVGDLRAGLSAVTGSRQALEQQRTALARMLDGRRSAIERTERTISSREAEVHARTNELETITVQRTELGEEIAAASAELARQRAVLQPMRERVAALSQSERETFELFSGRRSQLLVLERASMEAEAAVSRRAQRLERLRDEMDADGFELPPEQLAAAESLVGALSVQAHSGEPISLENTATSTEEEAVLVAELQSRVRSLRARVRNLGPINAQAEIDYRESQERHEFLTSQVADLQQAEATLQEALDELRRIVRERFRETFHAVNNDFTRYFKTFFGGGTARLALTEPEDYGESGVDILAQPPGKRQQHLQLLSGGERSMTAVALLFALLETNPAPFCVLDEVDAALDEANVVRFGEALGELAGRTQFIIITHNRQTIQAASTIYGVSMGGDGVSSVLSLRLEDVPADGSSLVGRGKPLV